MFLGILMILFFTFFYPIVMTMVWSIGGLTYHFRRRRQVKRDLEPDFEREFTVVIPVYNEAENIERLILRNLKNEYKNVKFWLINDCSTDETKIVLDRITDKRLKITHLEENIGKAGVLNYAIENLTTDYFICVDSDTLIYPDAFAILNRVIFNEKDDRVSAYNGSLTVNQLENENALLKVQNLEYRSIIGMIKRTHDVFSKNLMTVSGAFTCYKTSTLRELGGFDMNNATEDIEMTWRMSTSGYRSRFIEEICAEIFSPDGINELIKQRVRWNLGGMQVARKYLKHFFKLPLANRIYLIERYFSVFWVYSFIFTELYIFSKLFFGFPESIQLGDLILPTLILFLASLISETVAYLIDYGWKEHADEFMSISPIYPLIYWLIQPYSYLGAVWKNIFVKENGAKWRRTSKMSLRVKSVLSLVFDIVIYFFVIYLWQTIIVNIIKVLPNQMSSIYIGTILYWTVLAIIFYNYFISVRKATFGESLMGIVHVRRRSLAYNLLSPIVVFIMINIVLRFNFTLDLLDMTDYHLAFQLAKERINAGLIISPSLYPVFVLILIERYFGFYRKLLRNEIK